MARALTPAIAGMPHINLLPRAEVARRERETLTRKWVWGVLAAVVVTMLIIAGSLALKLIADQRLLAEQSRTNDLLVQLAGLSEVSGALATEEALTAFRADAMAADFAWGPVFAKINGVLPAGVTLTGFDLTAGGAPQTDDGASEPGLVGTFTLDSPNPIDIVAAVRSLRAVDGVLLADGQAVTVTTLGTGGYSYRLTVTFDQTIYSGAFAVTEGEN